MVLDHVLHVGAIERGTGQRLRRIDLFAGLPIGPVRQVQAFVVRDLLQFLVRLAVIFDHALAELPDLFIARLEARHFARPDLGSTAGGCLLGKAAVGCRNAARSLRCGCERDAQPGEKDRVAPEAPPG